MLNQLSRKLAATRPAPAGNSGVMITGAPELGFAPPTMQMHQPKIGLASSLPRLVHFDLKGAPPKLEYLSELLPLLKRMGATGLVLEYEDTFPFTGELAHLAGPLAYPAAQLRDFMLECHTLQLTVVPLIQTFGHVEFIFKHEQHKHLREHELYSNSLCPSNEEAFALIARILDQVMDFHGAATPLIHIGCDEVHQLGVCEQCTQRINHRGWSTVRLFCEHVTRVASYVRAKAASLGNRDVRVLIWDDMLRGGHVDFGRDVLPSGLQDSVQSVVWYYGSDAIPDVWDNMSHFSGVWAATAFKGASGPNETTPDTAMHVSNHKLWLAVLNDQAQRINWTGWILTAWSRYDHFGVLCELLPASIPSLALCLQTVLHGEFTELAHRNASVLVGYTNPSNTADLLIPIVQRPRPINVHEHWNFPGQSVYIGSHQQANLYVATCPGFFSSDWFRGWFHRYNEEHGRVNPGMLHQLRGKSQSLLSDWSTLRDFMSLAMGPIYKQSVIDEWLGTHVDPYMDKLNRVSERTLTAICKEHPAYLHHP